MRRSFKIVAGGLLVHNDFRGMTFVAGILQQENFSTAVFGTQYGTSPSRYNCWPGALLELRWSMRPACVIKRRPECGCFPVRVHAYLRLRHSSRLASKLQTSQNTSADLPQKGLTTRSPRLWDGPFSNCPTHRDERLERRRWPVASTFMGRQSGWVRVLGHRAETSPKNRLPWQAFLSKQEAPCRKQPPTYSGATSMALRRG